MSDVVEEKDSFIDPQIGANISYHFISWEARQGFSSTIPSGGNINHHSLPVSGSAAHTHEFAEIVLLLSGRLFHCVNGERQLLYPNSLVFVRPTDRHCFEPCENEKVELLFFDFRLESFLSLSEYLEDDEFLHQLTEPVLPPTFALEDSDASELCRRLLEINSSSYSAKIRKVKAKVILAELFSVYFIDEIQRLSETRVPDWLRKLCEEMRKPENFIVGLKRMRELACRTPEHLCKSFRNYLGKSPTEFINELRANHAARLLADTDEKIAAIAFDLNFQSLSRFYKIFQQHYGVSPKKFRDRAKRPAKFI